MGTVTPAVLQPGILLGATPTILFTGIAAQLAVVKRAVFTNTSGSPVTLLAYRLPSAGSVGATAEMINTTLAAGQSYVSPELSNAVVLTGDTIQATAGTASVVSCQIFGYTM